LFLFFFVFTKIIASQEIIPGAHRTELFVPQLENKNVGIVTNHTGLIEKIHLIDSLLKRGIKIKKIFCPEHGFRGHADAGELIENDIDPQTKIPIVSLYGNIKKPTRTHLQDIEILIFDMQDVGVRFYTYISTMHYVMEAAAENDIPLIVLDRPNPNGFYIDGPVLDTALRSFVGMHPIPVVYGMTIGELAAMINGEGWIQTPKPCHLTVIPCVNYTHQSRYILPVAPSPNLPNMKAVYLYPSLGFFEGTVVSCGRGTAYPFQVYGHPLLKKFPFEFTPQPMPGAKKPKFMGEKCYGENLQGTLIAQGKVEKLTLIFLIQSYQSLKISNFFNSYFNYLAGTKTLKKQIESGFSEDEIRNSWLTDIEKFKQLREKYLLYP